LDARGVLVLRVAGCPAAPLAEVLQVVERQVVAEEVEEAVEQHAAVPGRQDEPVPVGPRRPARIEAEMTPPEDPGPRRCTERQAGVARLCLVDRIDGQGSDGVDAELLAGTG